MSSSRLAAALALSLLACGGGDDDGGGAADAGALPTVFGGDRPATLQVPLDHDPARSYPLLIILHGYAVNGVFQQAYLGFNDAVDTRDVLVLAPDGQVDRNGNQYWNASDACCDFDDSGVDDVAYLAGLIEEIAAVYAVDRDRVHVVGHSNGGYMSFRLACERADLVASFASLAGGASFADPATCAPDQPVSALVIHGDADEAVPYDGGAGVPGARDSTARWATYDGCGDTLDAAAPIDLVTTLAGDETTVERAAGCPAGVGVELWTIQGGGHAPSLAQPAFADGVWAWLADHPKP